MDNKKNTDDLHTSFINRHTDLLLYSFQRATGQPLITATTKQAAAEALYHAPFGVLSHNTDADPVFNYGNQCAQRLFEMDWDTLTALPSRLSAESVTQEERDRLLTRVKHHGFIDDYQGIRITRSGKRFLIEKACVWNMYDQDNNYCGQAAALYQWSMLNAEQ